MERCPLKPVAQLHNVYNGSPLTVYDPSIDGWTTYEDHPVLGKHYHIVQLCTYGCDGVWLHALISHEVLLLSDDDFEKQYGTGVGIVEEGAIKPE